MNSLRALLILPALLTWVPGCGAPEAPSPAPAAAPSAVLPAADPWQVLFDGSEWGQWASTSFGGEGEVQLREGAFLLPFGSMLTGVHWTGPDLPPYFELEVIAARVSGNDFFCGLTFPVGDSFASAVLGGWGGALVGLSCVDGLDASDNETRSIHGFETGRDYTLRVRVDEGAVSAWLDGAPLFEVPRDQHSFELRPEVLPSKPLGVASFATTASLRSVRLRPLETAR